MSTKRVKKSSQPPAEESASESGVDTSGEAIRELLSLQQLLTKSTVQQLHLLSKINALPQSAKTGKNRNSQTSTQFNLLLSISELLQVQQQLSGKGNIRMVGIDDLLGVIQQTTSTLAQFELKATDKMKSGYDLSLEGLDEMIFGYFEETLAECQPTIDRWNSAVMKSNSSTVGSILKSPVDLAKEITETSDKIISQYRPSIGEPSLGKRDQPSQHMYEDTPMTHQLLKDLLNLSRTFQAELKDGIQFGNTEKFLRERHLRKSVKKEKVQYDERKDRKIKFDVHEKLVDFMPTSRHPGFIDNRDQILANLFGKASRAEVPKPREEESDQDYFKDVDLL